MRQSRLLVGWFALVACGGPQAIPDGGSGDATTDTDNAGDAAVDVQQLDVATDGSDAGVSSPAVWSKGFASTTFRGLRPDTLLLVDYTAGANVGTGSLTGVGCIGVTLSGADGTVAPSTPVVSQTNCSCWDGLHDPSYGSVVVEVCTSGMSTYLGCKAGPSTVGVTTCWAGMTLPVTPGTRTHVPWEKTQVTGPLALFDSLSSTIGCGLGPDQLGAWTGQCAGTLSNTNAAAFDSAGGLGVGYDYIFYGRQDGSSYDYSMDGVSTPVSGGGFFVAAYKNGTNGPALQWVKQLGGTPLKPASDNTVGPDEGVAHGDRGCVTFAFTGTVNVGTGPLTATTASHSIVLTNVDFNNPTTTGHLVASYDKGPAALGKTSTPHCAIDSSNNFVLVDTIWDWIDVGGTKVYATHSGGDVVVARISPTGTLVSSGVYGGPGTVKGSGVVSSTKAIIVGGQSAGGIDFGQGLLAPGAFIAGFAP